MLFDAIEKKVLLFCSEMRALYTYADKELACDAHMVPCVQVPLVLQLFDTLHALCNLLVVAPDNLKQVCSGEQLTNLDRNLLHAFVQLRADYRSARLGRHFS